jgi:hypothetical protein
MAVVKLNKKAYRGLREKKQRLKRELGFEPSYSETILYLLKESSF